MTLYDKLNSKYNINFYSNQQAFKYLENLSNITL